jgi:hypothetical protein
MAEKTKVVDKQEKIVHSTWYSYSENIFILNEFNRDMHLCGGSLTIYTVHMRRICATQFLREITDGEVTIIIYIKRMRFKTVVSMTICE